MADSWQMAIILYLCGMKQIEATPILDIVSRIVSIKADLEDAALLDSFHLILGEFGESYVDDVLYRCKIDVACGGPGYIEKLHDELRHELISLTNAFATSDISTVAVLEQLRNITADFYLRMANPYSMLTSLEVNDVIDQYTTQLEITSKLIEALKVRRVQLRKLEKACLNESPSNKAGGTYFSKVRLDVNGLKRLYENLCSEMIISNTSEETFLYVFGGRTLPETRTIRWEGSLSLLVALFDTVVRDYEVWKIASCCFEKMGKDGCYSMVDRNQLKTTKQRNQSSHKYTEYLKMIENFC